MGASDQFSLPGMAAPVVGAARQLRHVHELAAGLPKGLRMGTSSWSFPGWRDIVYDRSVTSKVASNYGLEAYCQHPLLSTVGLDRTFYKPVQAATMARYASQVGPDFRFLVKAHEACTLAQYPDHARYGAQRGERNPLFLDVGYARDQVVAPFVEGLGSRGGVLLFQFSPQSVPAMGGLEGFAEGLAEFLMGLPKGPLYAVEVRNSALLTPAYRAALVAADAVHCINIVGGMPDVFTQAQMAGRPDRPLVLRWMLQTRLTYEEAKSQYAPFDALAAEDLVSRSAVAQLLLDALEAGRDAHVIVNNKAEGCAPLSVLKLAEMLADGPGF